MLLRALEPGEPVPVIGYASAHLGPLSESQVVAIRRAARRLAEAGRARAFYRNLPSPEGQLMPQLVLAPLDSHHRGDVIHRGEPGWMRAARLVEQDATDGPGA